MHTPIRALALWAVLALALAGCGTPLQPAERAQIRRIGLVNQFPAHVSYVAMDVLPGTKKGDPAVTLDLRQALQEELARRLVAKGYVVSVLQRPEDSAGVDLTVRIAPREIQGLPTSMGYGFVSRSALVVHLYAYSYAALVLVPERGGKSTCVLECYAKVMRELPFKPLPARWAMLSAEQQAELERRLRQDIATVVESALQSTGL